MYAMAVFRGSCPEAQMSGDDFDDEKARESACHCAGASLMSEIIPAALAVAEATASGPASADARFVLGKLPYTLSRRKRPRHCRPSGEPSIRHLAATANASLTSRHTNWTGEIILNNTIAKCPALASVRELCDLVGCACKQSVYEVSRWTGRMTKLPVYAWCNRVDLFRSVQFSSCGVNEA